MTAEELEFHVRRTYRWNNILNYVISSFTMAGGLGLSAFYLISPGKTPFLIVLTFSLFLIAMGITGLVVIRNMYRSSSRNNSLSKQENIALLEKVASKLVNKKITASGSLIYFLYSPAWWRYRYGVYLTAENSQVIILVNTSGHSRGFIDFGAAKRMQQKILDCVA